MIVIVVGCAGPGADTTPDAADPQPEITGQQVDPDQGRCVGVVDRDPTWAMCTGSCELDEQSCLVAPSCRAVYADDLRTAQAERIFRACFSIAPPAASGSSPASCAGLDALACSRRDDCTAVHEGLFIYTPFLRCEPETCHVAGRTHVIGGCGEVSALRPP